MARSKSHKLILAGPRLENLFFDLERDPLETKNLYHSPEHREVIAKMETALDRWRSKDPRPKPYQDLDAPQIDQPNVPPKDLSHRDRIIAYFQAKMKAFQPGG
jgi:hypothetical protein